MQRATARFLGITLLPMALWGCGGAEDEVPSGSRGATAVSAGSLGAPCGQCDPGLRCGNDHRCAPLLENGASCQWDVECASGYCNVSQAPESACRGEGCPLPVGVCEDLSGSLCQRRGAWGDNCNKKDPSGSLVCRPGADQQFRCQAPGVTGEGCNIQRDDGTDKQCAPGFDCMCDGSVECTGPTGSQAGSGTPSRDGAAGMCTALGAVTEGAACWPSWSDDTGDGFCATGLICRDRVCVKP